MRVRIFAYVRSTDPLRFFHQFCDTGLNCVNGICSSIAPSGRARNRKRVGGLARRSANLCPQSQEACPLAGKKRAGYECIDTQVRTHRRNGRRSPADIRLSARTEQSRVVWWLPDQGRRRLHRHARRGGRQLCGWSM